MRRGAAKDLNMTTTTTERRTGHLKNFNGDRGYGFLACDDGERDGLRAHQRISEHCERENQADHT